MHPSHKASHTNPAAAARRRPSPAATSQLSSRSEAISAHPDLPCKPVRTLFETVRFGRSRIPPGGSLGPRRRATLGEEAAQEGGGLLRPDARDDGHLMAETGIGGQV